MKISAPEIFASGSTDNETNSTVQDKVMNSSFVDKIKEILKVDVIPEKFVVDAANSLDSEFMLQVLRNFTELCKEEILPRHLKASELLSAKEEELRGLLVHQQNQFHGLLTMQQTIKETEKKIKKRLEKKIRRHIISERMKEISQMYRNNFNHMTIAEKKMAQDLEKIQKKVEDLRVKLVEIKSQTNYVTTQVEAQTEFTKKHVIPLSMEKNTENFMKTNLNNTSQNIEDLVHRTKTLMKKAEEISKPENLEESLRNYSVHKVTFDTESYD